MSETIEHDHHDHEHDHAHPHDHAHDHAPREFDDDIAGISLEEKRLAIELTGITLSKNPDWDPHADWMDQADYAGKLFARILRYVREELDEDGDDEEYDDDELDDEDDDDDDDAAEDALDGDDDEEDETVSPAEREPARAPARR